MIKEYMGDVLKADVDIIAHQTNCVGVMGAGVAAQIKQKLLTPQQYQMYVDVCRCMKSDLLSHCQTLHTNIPGLWVVNLFGENIPTADQIDTNYAALENAIVEMIAFAYKLKLTRIAVPGFLGCGLAGGDWRVVYAILDKYFGNNPDLDLEIVWFLDEDYKKAQQMLSE